MTYQPTLIPAAPEQTSKRRRAIATIKDKHHTVCPATGKIRYRDRWTARQALGSCRWQRSAELAASGLSSRTEARIYTCPEPACNGGLHLTSIRVWRAA